MPAGSQERTERGRRRRSADQRLHILSSVAVHDGGDRRLPRASARCRLHAREGICVPDRRWSRESSPPLAPGPRSEARLRDQHQAGDLDDCRARGDECPSVRAGQPQGRLTASHLRTVAAALAERARDRWAQTAPRRAPHPSSRCFLVPPPPPAGLDPRAWGPRAPARKEPGPLPREAGRSPS
jgi:hypothetical protein